MLERGWTVSHGSSHLNVEVSHWTWLILSKRKITAANLQDVLVACENYDMENNKTAQGEEKTLLSVDTLVHEHKTEN